jgi:ABC-type cobalamin/Fe3+-siderophores transport system ATPase subunit
MDDGTITAAGKIDEVLNCEVLSAIYGIDIRAYFQRSLEKWK